MYPETGSSYETRRRVRERLRQQIATYPEDEQDELRRRLDEIEEKDKRANAAATKQPSEPLWKKALNVTTYPLRQIQEKVATPIASFGYGAAVRAIPGEQPGEKDIEKAGWNPYTKEYKKAWEETKLPLGGKFIAENLPWLLVPAVGAVGTVGKTAATAGTRMGARGIAGTIAKTAPKLGALEKPAMVAAKGLEYSPYGLMEKAGGAVMKAAGRTAKGAVTGLMPKKAPIIPKAGLMPDLQPFAEVVDIATRSDAARTLANLPGIRSITGKLSPSTVAKTTAEKASAGYNRQLDEVKQRVITTMAEKDKLGNPEEIWGKISGKKGHFVLETGNFAGKTMQEIMENATKYESSMTPAQMKFVEVSRQIRDAKSALLERNGIEIDKLDILEGGEYFERIMFGRKMANGQYIEMAYIGAGPKGFGGKLVAQKERVFATPEIAQKEGWDYIPQWEAQRLSVIGAYKSVAQKQMRDWLLENTSWRVTEVASLVKANSFLNEALKKTYPKNWKQQIEVFERDMPEVGSNLKSAMDIKDWNSRFAALKGVKEQLRTLTPSKTDDLFWAAEGLAQKRVKAEDALEALLRIKGQAARLPTGTLNAIIKIMPEAEIKLKGVNRLTLQDLIKAGKEAAEYPKTLHPPTKDLLAKQEARLAEAVAKHAANPTGPLFREVQAAKRKVSYTKYRMSEYAKAKEAAEAAVPGAASGMDKPGEYRTQLDYIKQPFRSEDLSLEQVYDKSGQRTNQILINQTLKDGSKRDIGLVTAVPLENKLVVTELGVNWPKYTDASVNKSFLNKLFLKIGNEAQSQGKDTLVVIARKSDTLMYKSVGFDQVADRGIYDKTFKLIPENTQIFERHVEQVRQVGAVPTEKPPGWAEFSKSPVSILKGEHFDAINELLDVLRGAPYKATTAGGKVVTKYRGGLIKEFRDKELEAKALRAEVVASARTVHAGRGEAAINKPGFAGRIFTLPEGGAGTEAQDLVKTITEALDPQFSKTLGHINKVNSVMRFFQLAGDASAFTIQLIFLAGAKPSVYKDVVKGFVKGVLDPEYSAKLLSEYADLLARHRGLIISNKGVTEVTEALGAQGVLSKLPVIKQILTPFARGYEGAIDTAGIQLAKAYDHLGTDAMRLADVDDFINEFRGLASSAKLGVNPIWRQVETAALLAPQYNRAIAALLSDVAKGGLRGDLARESLARGVAAIAAMTVAISAARGESIDEIAEHLDPKSPKFMTWDIGGQNIGPGSKVRSLIVMWARTAKDPGKLWEQSMENPSLAFVRGNLSPLASDSIDILTGKNYVGDPTREGLLSLTKEILAPAVLPLWVQEMALEEGNIEERGLRAGAQFGGMRAYAQTPYQEMAKLAQEQTGKAWETLQPYEKARLYVQPQIRELIMQFKDKGFVDSMKTKWEYYDQQLARDRELSAKKISGNQWREEYSDAMGQRAAKLDQIDADLGRIKVAPADPQERALSDYFKLQEAFTDKETGRFLVDRWVTAKEQYLARLDPALRKYVEDNDSIYETPMVKFYKMVQQKLKPYWAIEDQAWAKYPSALKRISDEIEVLENGEEVDQRKAKQMLYQNPTIFYVRKTVLQAKKQMLLRDPEMSAYLRRFYG